MRLLHLYYFKVLAENEHLLNTAKMIHISPPALSTTISKLEGELQVNLFDRVGRNIRLNENGKILYTHVCNIFSELDEIKRELSKTTSEQQDIVNIAVSAPSLWNEVIGSFIKVHPHITVKHSILRVQQLQNPESLNVYDLIITDIGDIKDKIWEHEFIIEDPPTLLVYEDHPFASKRSISLAEARDEPFIALSKGYSSREFFENSCKQAGFIPKIVAEADYALRAQLVENRYGIAFSSVLGARAIKKSGIKMIRVKYPPNPRIQTVFWKAGASLSHASAQLRDYLADFYKNN